MSKKSFPALSGCDEDRDVSATGSPLNKSLRDVMDAVSVTTICVYQHFDANTFDRKM